MALNHLTIFLTCVILESIAYGADRIALVLFVAAMNALRRHSRPRPIPLVIGAPLLFLFATLHLVGVIYRTYRGFIVFGVGGHSLDYFNILHTRENTAAQVGQVGAIIVSDLLAVWRVKIFCHSAQRIVFITKVALTFMGFVATCVTAGIWITIQNHTNPNASYFTSRVFRWNLSFYAASLYTTALSTGLIAWHLGIEVRTERKNKMKQHGHGRTSRILWILVDSAALYSLVNLLFLVLFASKSFVQSEFSTFGPPVASITFSGIILLLEPTFQDNDSGSDDMRVPHMRHADKRETDSESVDGHMDRHDDNHASY